MKFIFSNYKHALQIAVAIRLTTGCYQMAVFDSMLSRYELVSIETLARKRTFDRTPLKAQI